MHQDIAALKHSDSFFELCWKRF